MACCTKEKKLFENVYWGRKVEVVSAYLWKITVLMSKKMVGKTNYPALPQKESILMDSEFTLIFLSVALKR